MEKLKDIIYDVGDVLFSLIIVIIMVSVVTIKLSSAMDINILGSDLNTALLNKPVEDEVIIPKPETPDTIIIDDNDAPNSDDTTIPTETPSQNEDNEEVVEVVTDITLEIPKGSTAVSIANLLESKNLVDSSSAFLDRVQELKLDSKLKYGTFKIKSSYSTDKIISVITGVSIN